MRNEYQAIVDDYEHEYGKLTQAHLVAGQVATRCQALADKPPKMLTDEEILLQYVHQHGGEMPTKSDIAFARAIEAAHIAKQKEPETLIARIWRRQDGSHLLCIDDTKFTDCTLIKTIEVTI